MRSLLLFSVPFKSFPNISRERTGDKARYSCQKGRIGGSDHWRSAPPQLWSGQLERPRGSGHYQILILHFNVRFLIPFASLRIVDVIFKVLTDLVQSNPSLEEREVRYIVGINLVRCSVPISFAGESDLRTPKYGAL